MIIGQIHEKSMETHNCVDDTNCHFEKSCNIYRKSTNHILKNKRQITLTEPGLSESIYKYYRNLCQVIKH